MSPTWEKKIDNGCGGNKRHKENVVSRISKARGCFMKYLCLVWNNKYVNLELKMKLFESLVLSVLFYSLETVPVMKTYLEMLKNFVVTCYKRILNINRDIRISEKELLDIMNMEPIEELWRKRRRNAYSHIARLPYDNPARIVLFGNRNNVQNIKKRKFYNVNV